MIASEKKKVLRIFNFVGEKKTNSFEAVFAPVDVVSEEEIITFRGVFPVFEKSQEVVKLPVDVSADFQRRL